LNERRDGKKSLIWMRGKEEKEPMRMGRDLKQHLSGDTRRGIKRGEKVTLMFVRKKENGGWPRSPGVEKSTAISYRKRGGKKNISAGGGKEENSAFAGKRRRGGKGFDPLSFAGSGVAYSCVSLVKTERRKKGGEFSFFLECEG